MSKVLIVEDNLETQEIIKETLSGLELTICSNCEQVKLQLQSKTYDIVILDITLPDGNCHDLMIGMKESFKSSSILILTCKDQFEDKEKAFLNGALDYIQKPFKPKELRLKVLSHITKRQDLALEFNLLRVGSLICNMEELKLYSNKTNATPKDLTIFEYRIFKHLANTPNSFFTREDLLNKIWGNGSSVTPRTIDVHISNLRKKIQNTDVKILSKQGRGYSLHVTHQIG
jgi:DNA-binding response OmpR family regulator